MTGSIGDVSTMRRISAPELAVPVLPHEQVLRSILATSSPLATRRVDLHDALGMVLATDVDSEFDVPTFASSALDGYAARSIDLVSAGPDAPVALHVVGSVRAGDGGFSGELAAGAAIAIATGAPVPVGADVIVPWEDTNVADGHDGVHDVEVHAPGRAGAIRPAAEDIARGDLVASAGTRLTPLVLGAIAAAGVGALDVVPIPRVAILSTGDELVRPGLALAAGQRHDANSTIISSLVRQSGFEVGDVTTLPDDRGRLATWLEAAAGSHDLVITSGGASVGRNDWLRELITEAGRVHAWRVAIKPGKPIAFGEVHGTPIFALPGNPASVVVGMLVFVDPYLRSLAGRATAASPRRARLTGAVAGDDDRVTFQPVRLHGNEAVPLPARSSQVVAAYAAAHGLAEVPMGGCAAGTEVDIHVWNRE